AMRPIYYYSQGELQKIRGDRVAVGGVETKDHPFSSHTIQLEKGDTFYIFSDGYPDQFGGTEPNGKKYKMSRFTKQLNEFQQNTMSEQLSMLRLNMMTWQGNHPQVDDILIIGVRA
ncbi:MAG: SpoIIE family protein phosphatase, partial [Flavobacteriales bacterium]|nr:SpoIIE family protein phosphatase [Flavobacteriales bacterium]